MKTVIIFGNDHTNSLGLTQTLGMSGYYVVALLFGIKRDLVRASKYCKRILSAHGPQECIDLLLKANIDNNGPIPIIPSCDSAALCLENNRVALSNTFVFEYAGGKYSLHQLMEKKLQVSLAEQAGFYIPKTRLLSSLQIVPDNVEFPCLIKPAISCTGAKDDIRICRTHKELTDNLKTLKYTREVIIQQYIERDYEISVLGCALSNGDVIAPAVEYKLTLFPQNVGLECLARMEALNNESIYNCIQKLIKSSNYVGVFSIEMMHCKTDGKFYFTEINLRNDGANSFYYKYGVNLPLVHIQDLTNQSIYNFTHFNPGYYIWDMHHLMSVIKRDISVLQWVKELMKSKSFLTYFKQDPYPFYKQYINLLMDKLHLHKKNEY